MERWRAAICGTQYFSSTSISPGPWDYYILQVSSSLCPCGEHFLRCSKQGSLVGHALLFCTHIHECIHIQSHACAEIYEILFFNQLPSNLKNEWVVFLNYKKICGIMSERSAGKAVSTWAMKATHLFLKEPGSGHCRSS